MSCWTIIFAACLASDPLYDPQPDHPWNAVNRIFYAREFSNGVVYEHEAAFDPPWSTWSRFYNNAEFHDRVITILDRFLDQPEKSVEQQAAVRRAMLLRDLWPVFDAQTVTRKDQSEEGRARQQKIRERVASIMKRLELSREEALGLPDNFRIACEQRLFAAQFDGSSPEQPFLPDDLFDPKGPWVAFAPPKVAIAADMHLRQAEYRSAFVPLLSAAGDRQATLQLIEQYSDRKANRRMPVQLPAGTIRALVRRMILPTRDGELVVTPLSESLQLAIIEKDKERNFKFVLDRAALLSGGQGLRAVERQETLDAWGFGNVRTHEEIKYDTDGDILALGRAAVSANRVQKVYDCMICHQGRRRLFANSNRQESPVEERPFADQARSIIAEKQKSESWKTYQALVHREESGK
jgi:hypothetical protein